MPRCRAGLYFTGQTATDFTDLLVLFLTKWLVNRSVLTVTWADLSQVLHLLLLGGIQYD